MDKSFEKDFIRFARPSFGMIFAGVVGGVIGVIFAVCYKEAVFKAMCVIFALFSLGYCWGYYIIRYIFLNKKLSALRSTPDYDILMNDFKNAGRAFNDTVIMGDKFIIPKESGYFYAYDEIARFWQVSESTNGIEMRRSFYIYNTSGKKIQFFWVAKANYKREDYQSVCGYLLSKNDNIKFGEHGGNIELG